MARLEMEVYVLHGGDCVDNWWPEVFATPEEGMARIRDLLTHYKGVKMYENYATYSTQDNGEHDGAIELTKCKFTI